MLLPLTFQMNPASAMIMLAGIYYGAKYGGSTTSILLNVPGESASVVTCLDGYQMARKGRAGAALGIAAIASFIAGTVGVLGLMLVAPPLAKLALVVQLAGVLRAHGARTRDGGAARRTLDAARRCSRRCVGLWIAGIGTDLFSATSRFTFGRLELLSGIDFVVVAIGIFALGEVLANMETREAGAMRCRCPRACAICCRRSGPEGLPLRLRQRLGHRLSGRRAAGRRIDHRVVSFLRAWRRRFPRGETSSAPACVEGVAAPEGANNSETGGALVPLLTLGIPGSGTTAILLAALVLWGFKPGPLFIPENPGPVLGPGREHVHRQRDAAGAQPAAGARCSRRCCDCPSYVLYPLILGVSMVGVYSVSGSLFDLALLLAFGLLGYLMRKLDYPTAPLILGLVLGGAMERALRQSLMMSEGQPLDPRALGRSRP